jgi:hypothetical protein
MHVAVGAFHGCEATHFKITQIVTVTTLGGDSCKVELHATPVSYALALAAEADAGGASYKDASVVGDPAEWLPARLVEPTSGVPMWGAYHAVLCCVHFAKYMCPNVPQSTCVPSDLCHPMDQVRSLG